MPQIINTNIASLNAQRNLNASQGDANTALERLSSGLRINSAKDDAAGLAISTRFESQITGLNMAQRNANDGISLAQTAEGALDEVTSNLQRIRELAVQSANATNSTSDRQALNQEVQQRIAEINRVASQTSFNGLKILDGTFGEQTFQVGANAGETIGVSGLDSRGSQIGSIITETEGLADTVVDFEAENTASDPIDLDYSAAISADVTIGGFSIPTITSTAGDDLETIAADVQTGLETAVTNGDLGPEYAGLSVSADNGSNTLIFTNSSGEEFTVDYTLDDGTTSATQSGLAVPSGDPISLAKFFEDGNTATFELDINGTPLTVQDATSLLDVVSQVNSITNDTGIRANLNRQNDDIIFSSQFGDEYTIDITSPDFVDLASGDPIIDIPLTGDPATNTVTVNDIDISTPDGADEALVAVDYAFDKINGFRAELGAVQNRFESTIANLSTTAENLSASNSRIRDADFAAETAELARTQVLQSAGLSVLSQANARPQQVLQLLQG